MFPGWLDIYTKKIFQLPYFEIYTSTLGSFLSSVAGLNQFRYIGILLLPLAIPLSKCIAKDGWLSTINLTLTISIPLAPYGFGNDHVLLLPAVTEMITWIVTKKIPVLISWITAIGLITTYGVLLWITTIPALPYYWLFWIAFAIFILYFVAWRYRCDGH